ncbi:D-aminoacyl-tRNA deacylase [Peptoniphilus equinus]|uniref:D-aminoacyl-tRNA deacylase n=1 Tax=Peptoniphilus equinus TaxID=3016343 RepID=A0ABY7QXH3_9FIRM|nr:D-aminoacyl-tRNA deacylase [Peptoniphilus equinus]WBW50653.1 D-aminoacyl-tRNA deacylase [Peptoniphilus equinus]
MRAVVQRVQSAKVVVAGETVSEIGYGLMVLLGVEKEDTDVDLDYIYKKVTGLRVFDDANGVMNISFKDSGAELLVVSQFTLYGDARKGHRPSYIRAAGFDDGIRFYEAFIERAQAEGYHVGTGRYGADMDVHLVNHGPVTILLDSRREF